jgi:alkylation response protein AidB-like acyl-CoA dehydrogenase
MSTTENKPAAPGSKQGNVAEKGTITEDVMREAGKSEEEIGRTGTVDRADEDFEASLSPEFQTRNSPVWKLLWKGTCDSGFAPGQERPLSDASRQSMLKSIELVRAHVDNGTIYGADNRVREEILVNELGPVGYWGHRVSTEYGGFGDSDRHFMEFLTEMCAKGDPSVAGLASVHQCIGAVDPLMAFGNEEQKKKFLPILASGQRLSCFMLTEPGAGSDLTAVRTTAIPTTKSGMSCLMTNDPELNAKGISCVSETGQPIEASELAGYKTNGEKLFISNVRPGRVAGVVAQVPYRNHKTSKVEWKLNVFLVELPDTGWNATENQNFHLKSYEKGIWAVPHIHNHGVIFKDFVIPMENLLGIWNAVAKRWENGKGLLVAYHGLNRGRTAIAALGGGLMRILLASIVPWADKRETYGKKIKERELVLERAARIASLIVGADALRDWCSSLLDDGYRGELECIVAKNFGADATVEAAIWALKTHGGRSFLKGHVVGDNLHEFFAPSIYEGEKDMLSMAAVKSAVKDISLDYVAPLIEVARDAGVDMKHMFSPGQMVKLLKPRAGLGMIKHLPPFIGWALRNELRGGRGDVENVHPRLQIPARFARERAADLCRTMYRTMVAKGVKLPDEQIIMRNDMSIPLHKIVSMLATAHSATKIGDEGTILAAQHLCQSLSLEAQGYKTEIDGGPANESYRRRARKLGKMVFEGKFKQIEGVPQAAVVKFYENIQPGHPMYVAPATE